MINNSPIFLNAIPRSGGTLFVTMLDAHPQISMSYEIYEDRLSSDMGTPFTITNVLDLLNQAKQGGINNDVQWIKKLPDYNLRTFLYRARRSGLTMEEIIQDLNSLLKSGKNINTSIGRLEFIEYLMKHKALKFQKSFWGGKTKTDLYKLYKRYPNASFFIMIRDGRDIFASMKNNGSFNYSATQAANLWKESILNFRSFVSQTKAKAMEIPYETLVHEPAKVLAKVCSLSGLNFDNNMLSFYQSNLTLFENPHGHLSYQQLKNQLNSESIGRWRKDISDQEYNDYLRIAGDILKEMGYSK